MKRSLFLLLFYLPIFSLPSSIYDIQVTELGGNNINLSSYSGKKLVIGFFDGSAPDIDWLQYMDSLQSLDTSIKIIVMPANDFNVASNDSALVSLRDSLSLGILMLKPAYVKKSSGNNQHPLCKWLSDVNENTHFDKDIESAGQLFIVNRTGNLYSVLGNDVSFEILIEILNQKANQ